jgi:hypothetical protein
MTQPKRKLTVMVSSTVYGIEELLDRIYTLLTGFGYEVWMSHKGTVPVFSDRTAFENCLKAVEKCDLFLGLITPQYGSGQDKDRKNEPSITHRELQRAIKLHKPRWLLAHDHVVFAWSLLKNLGYAGKEGRKKLNLKNSAILDDLRVLDLYEEAIVNGVELVKRKGNWVQKFVSDDDASLFATAQFSRYQEVEAFIHEHFSDTSQVGDAFEKTGGDA